jgi:hypothetical protein
LRDQVLAVISRSRESTASQPHEHQQENAVCQTV